MRTSQQLDAIAPQLVAVQSKMTGIAKTANNTEFHSKYITLDTIVAELRPLLKEHGLMVLQGSQCITDEALEVETTVMHSSGQWITKTVVMPMVGRMLKGGEMSDPTPQTLGSAMSYGRRYGLAGFFCIASDEDDDGNAASAPQRRAEARSEVREAVRSTTAPAPAPAAAGPLAPDEESCPKCGGRVWDNRMGKKNPKAPDFKCRDRSCDGVIWPPKNDAANVPNPSVKPGRESAPEPFFRPIEDDEIPF